jgi:RNA polymerase sigma-54 factor
MKSEQDDERPESGDKSDQVSDYQDWDEYGYDDIPDYKSEYQNYFSSEDAPSMPIRNVTDFKEEARQQLNMLSLEKEDHAIALYLIDMLNANGLLERPLDEIADDLSFNLHKIIEPEMLERILGYVQQLEPVGLGARSIRECLLLQLLQMDQRRPDIRCAVKLVRDHYEDLMHRQFEKIQQALSIEDDELRMIFALIGKLKFHPVAENESSVEAKHTIIPDFIVTRTGDTVQVHLTSARGDNVYVNQSLYEQLAKQCSKRDRSSEQYIKSKFQSAQWFVNAIKQREETMLRIMNCIVELQHEYFVEGDLHTLKPMVLRNIAEKTGYDISTVSRITSNKYAETHFGIVSLKDLFSEGIADKKGEVISNKVIQCVIEDAISAEDKRAPFTDQQLVTILSGRGYNIARRTVAKYREQLQIPIAQIRAMYA